MSSDDGANDGASCSASARDIGIEPPMPMAWSSTAAADVGAVLGASAQVSFDAPATVERYRVNANRPPRTTAMATTAMSTPTLPSRPAPALSDSTTDWAVARAGHTTNASAASTTLRTGRLLMRVPSVAAAAYFCVGRSRSMGSRLAMFASCQISPRTKASRQLLTNSGFSSPRKWPAATARERRFGKYRLN